jgi:hypothetical protein
MKVFLSFAFNHGQPLTKAVERLLASHDIEIITGRRLGGETVDEAVKARILEADALVALVTRRAEIVGGGWTTSPAVIEELTFARDQKFAGKEKRAIGIIEDGVTFLSMANYETLPYQESQPLEAILALSETIASWRLDIGQELKVQILPGPLAETLGENEELTCTHRFVEKDIQTPWKPIPAIAEDEGTFIYLRGVRSSQKIQLRVLDETQKVTWQSLARSPWTAVQLKETKNG